MPALPVMPTMPTELGCYANQTTLEFQLIGGTYITLNTQKSVNEQCLNSFVANRLQKKTQTIIIYTAKCPGNTVLCDRGQLAPLGFFQEKQSRLSRNKLPYICERTFKLKGGQHRVYKIIRMVGFSSVTFQICVTLRLIG